MMTALLLLILISFLSSVHPQPDFFNDRTVLDRARRDRPTVVANAQAAIERLFAQEGPFQAAMNAQPTVYVALLFTVFREDFRRAFAGQHNEGQGNRLCVLLKFHELLPRAQADVTIAAGYPLSRAHFTVLKGNWRAWSAGRPALPVEGMIPPKPADDELLEVPPALEPLLFPMLPGGPPTVPFREPFNRFTTTYVAHYIVEDATTRLSYFRRTLIATFRAAHLKALFWMLIGRPLQQIVAQHPQLYGGLDAALLIPGAADGEEEGGDGGDDDPDGGGGGGGGGRSIAIQPAALPIQHLLPIYIVAPRPPAQGAPQAVPPNQAQANRVVPPVNPVRAAPPASGSCQAGPSGTVSTGAAGRTSQPTCSAAARPVAAPVVAAAPDAVAAPPAAPAAPERGNPAADAAGRQELTEDERNAVLGLVQLSSQQKGKQGKSQDDSSSAKKHKHDKPPGGGGGGGAAGGGMTAN